MIEQQGRVVSVAGNLARVQLGGQSGCSACDAGEGCGAGLFGRLLRRQVAELELPNTVNARAGDAVQVGIDEQQYVRLVAALYGAPLVAGLLGATAAYVLAGGLASPGARDLSILLGGLLAAGLCLLWLRRRLPARVGSLAMRLVAARGQHLAGSELDCQAVNHH